MVMLASAGTRSFVESQAVRAESFAGDTSEFIICRLQHPPRRDWVQTRQLDLHVRPRPRYDLNHE